MFVWEGASMSLCPMRKKGTVIVKWSDLADALNEWLDRLAGAPSPQPIPVRADDRRGSRPTRR